MFRSCSGKQTVQAVVLLLLLSPWVFGGGGTSFGQGAERVRLKALPTLSRIVRASVTSALPGGEARVSLITDEWLAVAPNGWGGQASKHLRRESLNGWGGASNTEHLTSRFVFVFCFLVLCLAILMEVQKSRETKVVKNLQANLETAERSSSGKSDEARGNYRRFVQNPNSGETRADNRDSVDAGKGVWDWLHDFEVSNEPSAKKDRTLDSIVEETTCENETVAEERRQELLSQLLTGEMSEESYFRKVNASFKVPLRCAPYCDQLRYTKFDPDSSWTTREVLESRKTTAQRFKKKRVKTFERANHIANAMSDADFEELCDVLKKTGSLMWIEKRKPK